MPLYKFTFSGEITIEADDKSEAEEIFADMPKEELLDIDVKEVPA